MAHTNGLAASQELQSSSAYTSLGAFKAQKSDLGGTVENFCRPIEDKGTASAESSDLEEVLATHWRALISQAANSPFEGDEQAKLAELVLAVQARKSSTSVSIQGQSLWSDLPLLGWQMREAWNLDVEPRSSQEIKTQWVNINAFTAKLVALSNEKSEGKPDYSLYAIWTIRKALEDGYFDDTAVSAAAVWFIYATPVLRELSQKGKFFDGPVAKGGFTYKNEDWKGFSTARWKAWSEKMDDFCRQSADEQATKLVQQARAAMDRA